MRIKLEINKQFFYL